ncbi:MAG: bifunctional UDP-N-acetylglucosamine diphosphorylase/glucosamine-1-phosphate N-acetyltransferase GlmU [Pseudomonadota bacterium]
MTISAVILAAGEGSRMRSTTAKVLHRVGGKTLLAHVVNTVKALTDNIYVVYSPKRPEVREQLADATISWVAQEKQLGTAHAVAQALPHIDDKHRVLVLYADVPLISKTTLQRLLDTPENSIAWLTAIVDQPDGLGRIIRDNNHQAIAICEETDLTPAQKTIKEINTGISLLPAKQLKTWMNDIGNDNKQNEYYITDMFALAVKNNVAIKTIATEDVIEIQGVNDKVQLNAIERAYQYRQAKALMAKGVTLMDGNRFDLRGELHCGCDVCVDVNVIIEGKVTIGNNVTIGANVYLRDVTIADNVTISHNTIIEEADIEPNCTVGPFARIRPGSKLQARSKIGNFVEIKKSTIGAGSKVNHLSYIGDTTMGQHVNIGAGTITCNYDGVAKHQTHIDDNVSIGANNSLVAPITIGKAAVTGAGSTICKAAPQDQLTVARARQISVKKRPRTTTKRQDKH